MSQQISVTSTTKAEGLSSSGPTQQLCDWISSIQSSDIPDHIIERAKYVILDGIACALTGANLPASKAATRAISAMEPGDSGSCSVFGHPDTKLTPLSAAVLNSTFIQGFELDDWHKDAPLHSSAILIPAVLAAAELRRGAKEGTKTSGADFLLSMMVGYEIGPRVGNALYGRHILTEGWHSGAVFGPSAAAAAVSKLYGLEAGVVEDALGIACTQACGLMSAQFESDVKRMQHGFAARNGLFGVLLAREGFVGIKRVYEREYGGFLTQFSKGNGKVPTYLVQEIAKDLGRKWQVEGVAIKPYAAMAATHGTIDCVRVLQEQHTGMLEPGNLSNIQSVVIKLEEDAFHHGGWKAERPLTTTGAQMSNAFVCATQLVDGAVLARQFRPQGLENDLRWELVNKTTCELAKEFPTGGTEVGITFHDGTVITKFLDKQRGVDPPLSNQEIKEKWRMLAKAVIDEGRMNEIEKVVLELEKLDDISSLIKLLIPPTENPLA